MRSQQTSGAETWKADDNDGGGEMVTPEQSKFRTALSTPPINKLIEKGTTEQVCSSAIVFGLYQEVTSWNLGRGTEVFRLFLNPSRLILGSSSFSFLGSTAQLRPWPPPQNPAEFFGGFSTIFFFTG
jgi:hypothetical protein